MKGYIWQEKVSDFIIIVRTADRSLLYKNTANTFSPTWRGCVMIFEPETFQNGGYLPIAYLFLANQPFFVNISWFWDRIWKIVFFIWKLFGQECNLMNITLYSSSGSEGRRYTRKQNLQKQLDGFFLLFTVDFQFPVFHRCFRDWHVCKTF